MPNNETSITKGYDLISTKSITKKETEIFIEEYGLIYLKKILYEILDKLKKIDRKIIIYQESI